MHWDILIVAMVAGFIGFRLYTVLGRRTGHERSPEERRIELSGPRPVPEGAKADARNPDNVVSLPEKNAEGVERPSGAVGRALMEIKLADRRFDSDKFLSGARAAYEMIVTAFARNERDTLHKLVSDDVFVTFDSAMRAREERRERVEFAFRGIKSARITGAELKGKTAEITVTFNAEFILAGYDSQNVLIEGDPEKPHTGTEVWTFARDTNSKDPNWILVATAGG